jgi:two-component system LytT family response regulator
LLKNIHNKKPVRQLTVKDKGVTHVIDHEKISHIEALAGYSKICYTEGKLEKTLISSHSISEYEEMLGIDGFYRIHKSYLVNCAKIKGITRDTSPEVLLAGSLKLPVGRRRVAGLSAFLKNDTDLTQGW